MPSCLLRVLALSIAAIMPGCATQAPPASGWVPPLVVEHVPQAPFPRPLALAATWDRALVRDVHGAIALEVRGRGAQAAAISLDVVRDPRRGIVADTFGEDVFLVAEMGIAAIEGLQGPGKLGALPPDKVLAAAASLAGPGPGPRGLAPPPLSKRELRDVYFPPFEAALARTGLSVLVVSRGEIDGVPAHVDRSLLTDVVRGEWKFDGAVLAAPGGIADLHDSYGVARDEAAAVAKAREAGIDAPDGARAAAVQRRAGLGAAYSRPVPADPTALSRRAAQRALVLLKNDGVLPLAPGSSRMIVVVGDEALAASLRGAARGRFQVAHARSPDDAVQIEARPRIYVLAGARPAATVPLAERADAVIGAWNLGPQGGAALAALLSGEAEPTGRLPLSIARNDGQLPMFHAMKPSARRGYLFDSTDPLYPFGWGLAYTRFSISAPRLSSATLAPDGTVDVTVDVKNVGARAGEEVVQLYARDKVASVTRPTGELKAFERVALAPGESKAVRFTLSASSLALWNERGERTVEPGEFEIAVGSSAALRQSATLTVKKATP